MKTPKNITILIVLLAYVTLINAQDEGTRLLKFGQLNKAKKKFLSQLTQNKNDYTALFNMGEYYLAAGNSDSAYLYYQKSEAANPKFPFNFLRKAKLNFLNGQTDKALENIEIARKLGKKNVAVFVEIGNIYASPEIKNYNEAKNYLTLAKSIDANYSGIYLLEGKIAYENKDFSNAASKFDQAIYLDSTQFEAYILIARIYASATNINSAITYLDKLLSKMPDCVIAHREKGDIYYSSGKYDKAKKAYEKYINNAEYTSDEIEKYAYILFFTKNYDKAQLIINELSHNNPDNYIMLRLLSYMHFEKDEYEKGVEIFKLFFTKVPSEKILSMDYEFYGKTLEHINSDSLAIIQYQMAILKDPGNTKLYETIARIYFKNKFYIDAVNSFEMQLKGKSTPLPSDYFQLARAYYFAANTMNDPKDSIQKKQYLISSDSIFTEVTTLSPNSYLGYLWRARTNSMLDPETLEGKAKPYYEKTLEFLSTDPAKYEKELIEVYSYMGFYYFVNNDKPASKYFWEKILDIDPSNNKAKIAMEELTKLH